MKRPHNPKSAPPDDPRDLVLAKSKQREMDRLLLQVAEKPPVAKAGIGHNRPPPELAALEGRVTLRVREVVAATGFSQSTVYEMMDDDTLPNIRVRGIRLIYADGLRRLLKKPDRPPPPGRFPSHGRRGDRDQSGTT